MEAKALPRYTRGSHIMLPARRLQAGGKRTLLHKSDEATRNKTNTQADDNYKQQNTHTHRDTQTDDNNKNNSNDSKQPLQHSVLISQQCNAMQPPTELRLLVRVSVLATGSHCPGLRGHRIHAPSRTHCGNNNNNNSCLRGSLRVCVSTTVPYH